MLVDLQFPSSPSRLLLPPPCLSLGSGGSSVTVAASRGSRGRRRASEQRNPSPSSSSSTRPGGDVLLLHAPLWNSSYSRLVVAAATSPGSASLKENEEQQQPQGGVAPVPAVEEEEKLPLLPPGLGREPMPRHVAVIMDGNSRWARERGLPTSAGHEAGYRALREIVRLSSLWGIKVLTVFAFSSENWLRPKAEVDFLLRLFEGVIRENLEDFKRQGIRLCIIGDSTKLPKSLHDLAKVAAEATKHNTRIELLVAVSYSGRSDIVQACQKIAQQVKDGQLEPADITESVIEQELETNCTINSPYPDLLIRTSGELRLSNFLLWQSAYSELYFSKSLWPDFGEAEYVEALCSFQERQRRFGQRIV